MYKIYPTKRYKHTINLLRKYIKTNESILDLGVKNPFTDIMINNGYNVTNTKGEDLDEAYLDLKNYKADVTTAFEILEHLVNPYMVLKNLPSNKLLVTVPLKLWFSKAYKNNNDARDFHYHEFEDWQFDLLLKKTGWKIIYREKWTNPSKKIGFRPILRYFTPRYYAVYAERV